MKDTMRDLEAFSSKMVSTIPTKCFVSVLENEKFPIVDGDVILKKGDRVKEDAMIIETRAAQKDVQIALLSTKPKLRSINDLTSVKPVH
jgi:hypothetical protein